MRKPARHLGICAAAVIVLSGCDGSRPAPASPTALPSASVQGSFTISGEVTEVVGGLVVPLQGVHVEDSMRHVFVMTGADGSYTIRDVYGGAAYLYFTKDGFASQTRQFTLARDTRVNMELARQ